jgi:alpha-beta hydrolase superfamily lysophospholipase
MPLAVPPTAVKVFVAFGAMLALASGCASFDEWQRRNIFQNETSARYGDREPPPGGVAYEIGLANGEHLHAWYVPADEPNAPTLLFLHGARRNLSGSYGRIELMRSLGFNVLAIDYRGFGRSSRLLPSEQSAIEDTRAAYADLLQREPDPGRRFVYGYSLGGALAIDLAAHTDGIAGLIVESTFTRIADLVRASRWHWVPLLDTIVTQEFDSIGKIAQVNEPLLLIHGTADAVVPHAMSDRLYAAAVNVRPGLRRVVKIDGATHWSVALNGGETYAGAVLDFVAAARAAMRDGSAAAAPISATHHSAATTAIGTR